MVGSPVWPRWLDFLFNIWLLTTTMKILPTTKNCHIRFIIILQNVHKHSKITNKLKISLNLVTLDGASAETDYQIVCSNQSNSLTFFTSCLLRDVFWQRQCDQLGWFLKVLDENFCCKSGQNTWWLFGLFRKTLVLNNNYLVHFLGSVWMNFGYFLFQHLVTLAQRDCGVQHPCLTRIQWWDHSPVWRRIH